MSHQEEVKVIRTTGRNNCGGRCVIHAHVRDGKIEKLTTDAAEAAGCRVPLTACVRGMNYHKTFLGEDRLRYPMKRTGQRGEGRFERITWQEAVDIIAAEWIRIRDTYGPGSRYVNYATGISALLRGTTFAKRLLSLDGGYLDYYNSYSTACIRQATSLMYGTKQTGNSLEDWLNANLIILWGHNPAETKFDTTMYYLKKAREKGIPIVVVDPRKNDTALMLGAEWIPIRPATDSAMMDAMAYMMIKENLADREFLDRCCLGFDKEHMPEGVDPSECYLSYVTGEKDGISKTPEWAQDITGVKADQIRSLAIRYATAKPAALIQGYGPQRNAYGEQSARGGILLACITGNVGIKGGWASGVADNSRHKNPSFPIPPNPYPMKIPVFLWTEAVVRGHELTELDGVTIAGDAAGLHLASDIKMILNLAGNCLINQHSHINRTSEILKDTSKCEFIVCSDLFMTPSAKFADILLPGVSMFECENITMPWQYGDFLGFNNKVIEPLYEGRFEYEWLGQVAEKLGLYEEFTEGKTAGQWLESIYNDLRKEERELPDYGAFKEAGIYRYEDNPEVIAFERERKDPDQYPFPTKSGKIEIFSEKIYRTEYKEFVPAIPRYVEPPEGHQDPLARQYPLQLIGWHTKRRCHSIHDNNRAMDKVDPQVLWIHEKDAHARGLKSGDEAFVWNDRGRIRIPVKVTDRIMEGVAALSQGAWYHPDQEGTDRAGSINVLTSLRPTAYAKGNPQHTNLVEVKKAEGTEKKRDHIAGYILAGGSCRRMEGKKKLYLEYEGEAFYRRILKAMKGFERTYLSVEKRESYENVELPLVEDRYPGLGPLGGICTGLETCREQALFVAACDMPLIDGGIVEKLVIRYEEKPGIVVAQAKGRLQPLLGIYPKKALPLLLEELKAGNRKMTEAIKKAGYEAVELGDQDYSAVNINTPKEYSWLLEHGKKKAPFLFAVSGFKNTGKTTMITRLIPELNRRGYKVAVVKHDGHDFESDVPGTDSYRFQKAGAYGTAVYSSRRFMVAKECREPHITMLLQAFGEADIILIEGLKDSSYPKYICNYPLELPVSAEELADRIEKLMKGRD